ncbi:MAG: helix-turn-helix transcriptional regulator [Polyangiales bacterium]
MTNEAHAMAVEAEVQIPFATVQIARFHVARPADNLLCAPEAFWLDLSLTPRSRNARACYRDHWAPHRFERLGTLFALPPGQTMHARSDAGSQHTSLLCHLRPEPTRAWFEHELEWTDPRLKASLDIDDTNLRGLFMRIAEELRHPGFASAMMVELMVAQAAIELGRYWSAIEDSPASGGLAPWRIRRIEERLRELGEPPSLEELAKLCSLSVRQLTRGFRTSFQRSIGEHVALRRLEQAKHLLASGKSVKEAAYAVGFASPSSFIVAFRRATGQTPRQFRARS